MASIASGYTVEHKVLTILDFDDATINDAILVQSAEQWVPITLTPIRDDTDIIILFTRTVAAS